MKSESFSNKRIFPRRKLEVDSDLIIGGSHVKAKLIDLSIGGIGILAPQIDIQPATTVDVKVDQIGCETRGTVVWTKQTDEGIKIGIQKMGPIRGKLQNYGLSDILIGFKKRRKTGILEIDSNDLKKKIYFKQGEVIFSSSEDQKERMGEMLIDIKKITADQYHEAVETMQKTGKRLGAVLVERGYLSPADLSWAVRYQVEKIILNLFRLEEGDFIFRDEQLPIEEIITLKLSTGNLIYRGIKDIDDIALIKKSCPVPDSVLYFSSEPFNLFQQISLTDNDKRILMLVNGKKTLKEIISQSPLSEEGTLKALYALYNTQLIEVVEEGEVDASITQEEILGKAEEEVDQAIIDRIEKFYKECKTMSNHGILAVSKTAAAAEIKRSYYKLAKEYHPDRYLHVQADALKAKLNTIFSHINQAYKSLMNGVPSQQPEVVGTTEDVKNRQDSKEMARSRYQEGRSYLSTGNYEQALISLGQATYMDSSVPGYHFYYGVTLYQNNKIKDAEISIRKAVELAPNNADYVAELGNLYLKLGFKNRAKNTFERALKLSPSHKKASEGFQKSNE